MTEPASPAAHPHSAARHPQPRHVSPAESLVWLKAGWTLFIRNPGVWIAISVIFIVMLFVLGLVPLLGWAVVLIGFPIMVSGMVLGCHAQTEGRVDVFRDGQKGAHAKEEGQRPRDVEVRDAHGRKLVEVYQAYEEQCQRSGLVDFAELLLRAHELWLRICGRVFAQELRQIPPLAVLSRSQQEAWFATARALHLALDQGERIADASTLVLARGRLHVQCGAQHLTLSAPALVQLPAAAAVTALSDSRFALLAAQPETAS